MNPAAQHARQRARVLLLNQKTTRLPINVERLSFECEIIIDSLQHYCVQTDSTVAQLCAGTKDALKDGCTLVHQRWGRKIYIILYNARAGPLSRQRFTLAHEVGHIYLGHTSDNPENERQANAFAAELLMPRVLAARLLAGLPSRTDPADALARTFAVSTEMAHQNLRHLGESAVLTPQEQELLKRYEITLPRKGEPMITY